MTEEEMSIFIEFPYGRREAFFTGTEIRVEHVIDDLASGMSFSDILKEHKALTEKHIQATFVFIKSMIKNEDALSLAWATGTNPWFWLFGSKKSEKQG